MSWEQAHRLEEQERGIAYGIMEAAQQRLDASTAQFFADRIPLDRVREAQEARQNAAEQFEIAKVEYARSRRQFQFESGNYRRELQIHVP